MKLDKEFYRLPLSFDIARLQQEIAQFAEADWTAHHESFEGNSAIALISVDGSFNNEFKGPMLPTPALEKCAYIQQVIASFGEVIGRSRLMRLAPGCEVPLHSDINYHWHNRVRIHIPITTQESVQFHCADKQVHMGLGECWIFDSWKYHKVVNNSDSMRVHLVIDTMGSSRFWRMIEEQSLPIGRLDASGFTPRHLPFTADNDATIITEKVNFPIVMHPSEIKRLTEELSEQIKAYSNNNKQASASFIALIRDFCLDWQAIWSQFGEQKSGWGAYHHLRQQTLTRTAPLEHLVWVDTQTPAMKVLVHLIMGPALSPELAQLPSQPQRHSATSPMAVGGGTQANKEAALSRNSPCPCGSGKKYKQCHGQLN